MFEPRQIAQSRQYWRAIPADLKRDDPRLVSRVQLTENGPIVGIFQRKHRYLVLGFGDPQAFGKLADAEDFAAKVLVSDVWVEDV